MTTHAPLAHSPKSTSLAHFLSSASTGSCQFSTRFATRHHASPCFGAASAHRLTTAFTASSSPCRVSNLKYAAQWSPTSGFSVTARLNHPRALSILRSSQNRFAIDAITAGSLSHRLSASTDFDFRCGRGAILTASAQSIPDAGHSCNAFAMSASAARSLSGSTPTGFPPRSCRAAVSHSVSFAGLRRRACSRTARAFAGALPPSGDASNAAAAHHSGIASGHRRVPLAYAFRAASTSPSFSSSCPSMIHIFQNCGNFSRPSDSSLRSAATSPTSRSTTALFIHTRSLAPPFSRAFASSARARSGSRFSNSSLNAASQMSSLSELATNASSKMSRAPATSPASHRSFAAISHKISACGQLCTARFSTSSIAAISPAVFSSVAARTHSPFFAGKVAVACA
mmetsp:Transcript_2317/g.7453  ORF Transcript_2317/g.7453 Transcript_2317/m.7453 type:complete len:399 (+) Transcript_2317:1185-2381(+)